MAKTVPELAKEEAAKFRTFKHLYAGANTIMEKGKKLVFGGPAGAPGFYTTKDEDEIAFLVPLSETPGSMVTEVKLDADGREIVQKDEVIEHDKEAALEDSRANSKADLNPAVNAAREALAQNIAKNS